MCSNWYKTHPSFLTLIPISFFPTYSLYHALVTRYLNKMKQIVTIFLARSLPDSVAKRITRQTSNRKDCGSNSPGGECIYNSNQKEDGREKYNMVQGRTEVRISGGAIPNGPTKYWGGQVRGQYWFSEKLGGPRPPWPPRLVRACVAVGDLMEHSSL